MNFEEFTKEIEKEVRKRTGLPTTLCNRMKNNGIVEILQKNMKGVKLNKRLYAIKHYILFSYLTKSKNNVKQIRDLKNKILYVILYLPGILKSRNFK